MYTEEGGGLIVVSYPVIRCHRSSYNWLCFDKGGELLLPHGFSHTCNTVKHKACQRDGMKRRIQT